jgi:ubiquinone/menaquinone biosynthesis C-methylase UbiE
MNLPRRFMRVFFNLLYHPFAFAYDFVAAVVSFGKWNDWVLSVIPFIGGTRILELGHGPGHLQQALMALRRESRLDSVAIDESAPMGKIARRRLGGSHKLVRAVTQKIPFPSKMFDSVIATFPSEYIFDARTLSEAHRVLRSGGRLIVLLAAWPRNPLLGWLFKVTGQSPAEACESVRSKITETLAPVNFQTDVQVVEVKSGNLLIIVAQKRRENAKEIT